MSHASKPRTRRLNLRALAIMGVVLLAALPGLAALKMLQEARGRTAFKDEAKKLLAKKQPALALSYLNRYLVLDPRDVEALELKADLLADSALHAAAVNRGQAQAQLVEASQALSQLLGIDPDGPKRPDTRIKLLRINLETDTRAQVCVEQAEKVLLQLLKIAPERGRERAAIKTQAARLAVEAASATKAAPAAADPARVAELLRLSARGYEYWSTYGAGENQVTQDRLARALEDYEAAERITPGDVAGAELLASLFLHRLKDTTQGRKVLDRVVSATAKDPKKHSAALLSRHLYLLELTQQSDLPRDRIAGISNDARADIDLAIKEDPENVQVLLSAARFALFRNENSAARQYFSRIPLNARDEREVRVVEGTIALAEQRRDDAVETWRAGLIKGGGADPDLTWKLASVLLESNRMAEARPLIDQFGRLVGGKTPSPRYLFLKGFDLLKSNRPEEAVALFEPLRYEINKPDPGDNARQKYNLEPSLYFMLGQAYEASSTLTTSVEARDSYRSKALEAYRQSADMSPEWSPPWQSASRMLRDTQPAEAVGLLRRGLALNPSEPRLLADLAQILYREQMAKPEKERSWAEIERLIRDAKKNPSRSPEVALVEADYLAATGRWEEALGLLDVASKLQPQVTELWIARVNAAIRRNQYGMALDILEEAVAKGGHRAEFYIARSSVFAIKGDVTRSRDALTEGLSRSPIDQRPALLKTLGDFHKARRDFPGARSAYEEWTKLRPDDPAPRIGLVEVSIASGDEAAINRAIDGVRGLSAEKGHYWQYARVEDLLRTRSGADADPSREADRFRQARALIDEIKTADPKLALGPYLEGRLGERQGKTDDAVKGYKAALALKAGSTALNPLVAMLVREKREADLNALRVAYPDLAVEIDKLAVTAAIQSGNRGRAEQLAQMAVEGNPEGLNLRLWQAEVLRAIDKPKEAEAALNTLIAQKPDAAAPWLQLLMLQVNQKRAKDAAETVEKIRKVVKSAYPEILLAQCYRAIGNVDQAVASYQSALLRLPSDQTVLTSAVLFYQQIGRREDAEQTMRSILRRDGSHAWARRNLALSLAGHTNDQSAWEEATRLAGPEPGPNDTPEDLMARARVYAFGPTVMDRRKAIAILEGLLAELPELVVAQDLVARLHDADGKPGKALEHASKAAAGNQATPEAILFYVATLIQAKDFTNAEAQIERLAKIDPTSLPVAEQRARLLLARGHAPEAASVMEKAFEGYSSGSEAALIGKEVARLLRTWGQGEAADRIARKVAGQSTLGRCILAEQLAAGGKNDEAATQLEEAAKAGDLDAAGGSALSLAITPKADPRWLVLADRFLNAAVKRSPSSLVLQEKLALVKHLQGKFPDEIALYQSMLASNPGNFEFLNNMAWTLSEEMNQPKDGLRWADEAVKKAGPKSAILDTRGVILTRLSQYDRAIRDLELATRDNPNGPFLYHLARAYLKAGRGDDARKSRDLAVKAGFSRDQLQRSEVADWDALMTTK